MAEHNAAPTSLRELTREAEQKNPQIAASFHGWQAARNVAAMDLGFFAGCGNDHGSRLRGSVSVKLGSYLRFPAFAFVDRSAKRCLRVMRGSPTATYFG